jgi:Zinc finger C-x8-C-x5-C-x3-H type (and similar)
MAVPSIFYSGAIASTARRSCILAYQTFPICAGDCKYGDKCQFAHGEHEIVRVKRHPKYRTQACSHHSLFRATLHICLTR